MEKVMLRMQNQRRTNVKKRYAFCILAVFIVGAIGSLHAQEGRQGGRRGGQGRPDMMRRFPLMIALDVNGDGIISAEEINNAPDALRKLDKNNDGQLTEDELRPNFPDGPDGRRDEGPGGPNPDEMVKQLLEFDKNGDGHLSKDELPGRMHGLFERGDTNKDGVLSKDELRKLAETQSAAPRRERDEHDDHRDGERRPARPSNQQ